MYVLAWYDPDAGTSLEVFATYDGAWSRLLILRSEVDETAQMRFVSGEPTRPYLAVA